MFSVCLPPFFPSSIRSHVYVLYVCIFKNRENKSDFLRLESEKNMMLVNFVGCAENCWVITIISHWNADHWHSVKPSTETLFRTPKYNFYYFVMWSQWGTVKKAKENDFFFLKILKCKLHLCCETSLEWAANHWPVVKMGLREYWWLSSPPGCRKPVGLSKRKWIQRERQVGVKDKKKDWEDVFCRGGKQ